MPAYDRPMVINTEQRRGDPVYKAIAATIRFTSQDRDRIKEYLDRMVAAGVIAGYEVGEYDIRETSPALYFP